MCIYGAMLLAAVIISKTSPINLTGCKDSSWRITEFCPKNIADRDLRSTSLKCSSECVYHCLLNEYRNNTLEGCDEPVIITGKYCAQYNMHGNKIQPDYEVPCGEMQIPCPLRYPSNETFIYLECLKTIESTTTISTSSTACPKEEKDKWNLPLVILAVMCSTEALGLVVSLLYICLLRRRNRKEKEDDYKDQTDHVTSDFDDAENLEMEHRKHLLRRDYDHLSLQGLSQLSGDDSTYSSKSSVPSTLSEPGGLPYVVVFNIGRKYTGYGFSVNRSVVQLQSAGTRETCKLLSALLLDCDPRTGEVVFDAEETLFGFEARDKYGSLTLENRKSYLFFPSIAVKQCSGKFVVKDIMGNERDATEVLKYFISCLQTIAIHRIKEKRGDPTPENTIYVAVSKFRQCPGIENLIQEAAIQAGIREDKLRVVKEADTYPLCLRKVKQTMLCINCTLAELPSFIKENNTYTVLDLGEGGTNIVIYRINADREDEAVLHEYVEWGETGITTRFMEYIFVGLLGKDCIDDLRSNHYSTFINIEEQIELQKRKISRGESRTMIFHLPRLVDEILRRKSRSSLKRVVETSVTKYAKHVTVQTGENGDSELEIKLDILPNISDQSISKLRKYLDLNVPKHILSEVTLVYLIGGYANYEFMQNLAIKYFKNRPVIVPNSPELAVVKGAAYHKDVDIHTQL